MTVEVTDYATINDPDFIVQHEMCTPRWKAQVAGIDTYPDSFSLDLNGHGATDTGSLTFGIEGLPDWSIQLQDVLQDGAVPIEVFIGYPADENTPNSRIKYVSMFLGLLDIMRPAFDENSATFDFRSYGSILTAYKITASASNMTTKQFIEKTIAQLNAQFGLNINVKITLPKGAQAATMAAVFGKELSVGLHNATVWSVLLACAEVDDVLLWFEGTTLHYENAEAINRTTKRIVYGRDVVTLHGTHSPQYNRNIEVQVRTWSPKQKHATISKTTRDPATGASKTTTKHVDVTSLQMFGGNGSTSYSTSTNAAGDQVVTVSGSTATGGSKSTGFIGFSGESSKEIYIIKKPHLSIAEANALGIAMWKQYSRLEYQVEFELALTPSLLAVLDITTLWQITGIPWDLFNSVLASGGSTVTSGGTSKIINGVVVPDAAPIKSTQTPTQQPKNYYARKISIKGDVPQDESGVSTGSGLTVIINALNHSLANSAA